MRVEFDLTLRELDALARADIRPQRRNGEWDPRTFDFETAEAKLRDALLAAERRERS